MSDTENEDYKSDAPLLDSFGSGLKKLIAKGKELGYITIEELNQALPSEKETSDQIEDIMAAISDMEISIISADETEDFDDDDGAEEPASEEEEYDEEDGVGNLDAKELMRSDDPVRMYLKEMGSVELLSREGEIAIAKRIEAGKTVMIDWLCENPMTLKAISKWRDELVAGTMQLRNIIDLEMMYGVDSEAIVYEDDAAQPVDDLEQVTKELEGKDLDDIDDDLENDIEFDGAVEDEDAAEDVEESGALDGDGEEMLDDEDDEDGAHSTTSITAMETALFDPVLEILNKISSYYDELSRIQSPQWKPRCLTRFWRF